MKEVSFLITIIGFVVEMLAVIYVSSKVLNPLKTNTSRALSLSKRYRARDNNPDTLIKDLAKDIDDSFEKWDREYSNVARKAEYGLYAVLIGILFQMIGQILTYAVN